MQRKLIRTLILTIVLFLLFASALTILAIRKDILGHFAFGMDHLLVRQTTTLILVHLLAIVALPILVGLIVHGSLKEK